MSTAYVLAALCALTALSEVLVRHTRLKHLGTALLVILLTAVAANLGLVPAGSPPEAPVVAYDLVFAYLAPLSIFWILLRVDLRSVRRAGFPLLALFVIGSLATCLGVLAGMALVDGADVLGPDYAALGGAFAGTYTGGSVNFNAVALHYDLVRDGTLFAGAVVADNIVTALWMLITIAAPRALVGIWPGGGSSRGDGHPRKQTVDLGIADDTEDVHPLDLALSLALGLAAMAASDQLAALTGVPSILVLTAAALVLAQVPIIARLSGPRTLGMFAVYLFLAVIGAFCDLRALAGLGSIGLSLLAFAGVTVLVHGVVTFAAARALRLEIDLAAVASQANVGGGTSALALARSIGRTDLVLPAVLLGALGNALGTFLGFATAAYLLPHLSG